MQPGNQEKGNNLFEQIKSIFKPSKEVEEVSKKAVENLVQDFETIEKPKNIPFADTMNMFYSEKDLYFKILWAIKACSLFPKYTTDSDKEKKAKHILEQITNWKKFNKLVAIQYEATGYPVGLWPTTELYLIENSKNKDLSDYQILLENKYGFFIDKEWAEIAEKIKNSIKNNETIEQNDSVSFVNKISKYVPEIIAKYTKKPVAVYKKEDMPEELYWKIDNTKYPQEFLDKCSYVIVQEVDWKEDIYPIEDDKFEKNYEKVENKEKESFYEDKYLIKPAFIAKKPWITEMIKIKDIFGNVNWKIQAPWWETQDFSEKDYLALVRDKNKITEVYKVEAESNWNPAMYELIIDTEQDILTG